MITTRVTADNVFSRLRSSGHQNAKFEGAIVSQNGFHLFDEGDGCRLQHIRATWDRKQTGPDRIALIEGYRRTLEGLGYAVEQSGTYSLYISDNPLGGRRDDTP